MATWLQEVYSSIAVYPMWAKAVMAIAFTVLVLTPVFVQTGTGGGGQPPPVDYAAKIGRPLPGSVVPGSDEGVPFEVKVELGEAAITALQAPGDKVQFWLISSNAEGDKYWPQRAVAPDQNGDWRFEMTWPMKGAQRSVATLLLFAVDSERAKLAVLLGKRANHITRSEFFELSGLSSEHELDRVTFTVERDE